MLYGVELQEQPVQLRQVTPQGRAHAGGCVVSSFLLIGETG